MKVARIQNVTKSKLIKLFMIQCPCTLYTCIAQVGSSRRDFSNSSSDYNHRYENHGRSSRDTSSHRRTSGRQSSPPRNSRSSGDRSKERMGPPSRPPMKKFRSTVKGSGGSAGDRSAGDRSTRDTAPARGSVKKTKIMPSTSRSTVVRRRLVLRQRDSARRVKLARIRRYRMINMFSKFYCLFSNTISIQMSKIRNRKSIYACARARFVVKSWRSRSTPQYIVQCSQTHKHTPTKKYLFSYSPTSHSIAP